jgi:hypothetical protein
MRVVVLECLQLFALASRRITASGTGQLMLLRTIGGLGLRVDCQLQRFRYRCSYGLSAKLSVSTTDQTAVVSAATLTLDTVSDAQSTVLSENVVQNLPTSRREANRRQASILNVSAIAENHGLVE